MPKKLRQIVLDELSLVVKPFRPVNPEAKSPVYKSGQEDNMKENLKDLLQKALGVVDGHAETPPPATPPPAQKPAEPVEKGKTVETSTYTSQSQTVREDAGGGATPVQMAAPAPVPAAPAASAPTAEDRVVKAVVEVIKPVADEVRAFGRRVEALEKTVPASSRITVGEPLNKAARFPEFSRYLEQTAGQRLSKAAILTSDFTYGLTEEESARFIDYMVDQSALLKRIRTPRLNAHQTKIDKLGLGTNVLKKQTQGTDPGETVSVTTSQIALNPKDIIAVVRITDNVLADNIEGEAFLQHLLNMVSRSASNELELAGMMADDAVPDTYIMDIWDGWYTRAIAGGSGAHITDATGDADRYWPGTDQAKAVKLLKTLPHKYRLDPALLAWIQNPDIYLDYQDTLAGRETGLGDQSVTGRTDVPLRGIANIRMPLLPTNLTVGGGTDGTFIMLTNPQNLIMGFRKQITIESDRLPRLSATDWVITFRADVQVENLDAVAIYKNAKVK